jgi:hypothetical protein
MLRALARDGTVSHKWVQSANGRLGDYARSRFGSLAAAVNAAGLCYIRWPNRAASSAGHWNEQSVLQTLRDLHRGSHDLRYRHMKDHSQPLFFAAKRLFGSYVNAVKRAGINYWEMSQAQLAKERTAAAAGRIEAGE